MAPNKYNLRNRLAFRIHLPVSTDYYWLPPSLNLSRLMKTIKPLMLLKWSGPSSRFAPHIDLRLSLDDDCSTWLSIVDWWPHDEKLQKFKIILNGPHKKKEMACKNSQPLPHVSSWSAFWETEPHPWWPHGPLLFITWWRVPLNAAQFLECNNKY